MLLLITYVILFTSTITESMAIGWLFLISAVLGGYCLIVMCSKTEKRLSAFTEEIKAVNKFIANFGK